MGVKIIEPSPDIYVTREEYHRLAREWEQSCRFMVNPPSLDEYIANAKRGQTTRDTATKEEV